MLIQNPCSSQIHPNWSQIHHHLQYIQCCRPYTSQSSSHNQHPPSQPQLRQPPLPHQVLSLEHSRLSCHLVNLHTPSTSMDRLLANIPRRRTTNIQRMATPLHITPTHLRCLPSSNLLRVLQLPPRRHRLHPRQPQRSRLHQRLEVR